MKIVTWNIAGIKARHETLYQWLQQNRPDIVCLQEIKSTDKNFPRDAIESLGYHIETHGQKSFNGLRFSPKKHPMKLSANYQAMTKMNKHVTLKPFIQQIKALFVLHHSIFRMVIPSTAKNILIKWNGWKDCIHMQNHC